MTSNHRLKVGVDFGTTFSGISWIHTSKPDEVNVVTKWPGTTHVFAKVPSEISYNPKGEVHKWGYQIKLTDEKIAWFKLLLQPTQYSSSSTGSSMFSGTNSIVAGKKPVEIVADYLACLRSHFLETIKVGLGKAFLDATPIDYTLTVPAIWKDAAKALTLEAAEKAGFGDASTIRLMSEPDAAAAWTLLRDINPNNLKVNDAFVVVDCGGGTVDLVSYEIQKLEPFTVRECAKGTGGLCGSVFLNEGFKELVKSRIGARFEKMKPVAKNRILKEWEEVLKREFSNSEEDDIFSCPINGIPDDHEMGIEGGDFMITREEMLGIFDPVINKIIPLVQEQIDMVENHSEGNLRISAILLVGGFGESKYLSQRLEQDLKEGGKDIPKKLSIEILQPINAWSAVSRGAALGIRISSRKARRHYGVRCSMSFIHGVHPLRNLIYDECSGDAQCNDCIQWYIEKYHQVSEDTPLSLPFSRNVPIDNSFHFVDDIIDCDHDKKPQYLNQTDCPPLGEGCKVHSNLSMVPRHLFPKKIGPEKTPYYQVFYNLIMTIRSGDIHFEVEFKGKKYGNAKAKYVHD